METSANDPKTADVGRHPFPGFIALIGIVWILIAAILALNSVCSVGLQIMTTVGQELNLQYLVLIVSTVFGLVFIWLSLVMSRFGFGCIFGSAEDVFLPTAIAVLLVIVAGGVTLYGYAIDNVAIVIVSGFWFGLFAAAAVSGLFVEGAYRRWKKWPFFCSARGMPVEVSPSVDDVQCCASCKAQLMVSPETRQAAFLTRPENLRSPDNYARMLLLGVGCAALMLLSAGQFLANLQDRLLNPEMANWIEYRDPEKTFKVLMPSAPNSIEELASDKTWYTSTVGQTTFTVIVFPELVENERSDYEITKLDFKLKWQAKVLNERRNVGFNGYSGDTYDLISKNLATYASVRYYYAKKKIFVLIVIAENSQEPSKYAGKFFDSFEAF